MRSVGSGQRPAIEIDAARLGIEQVGLEHEVHAICRLQHFERAGAGQRVARRAQRHAETGGLVTIRIEGGESRARGLGQRQRRGPRRGEARQPAARCRKYPAGCARRRPAAQARCQRATHATNALPSIPPPSPSLAIASCFSRSASGTRSAPISGNRVGMIGPSSGNPRGVCAQQFFQRDAHLEACQRRAQAHMRAAAEGHRILHVGSTQAEARRILEHVLVAIGRGVHQRDGFACRNGAAMQRDVGVRRAREAAIGRVQPQEFLGGFLCKLRIVRAGDSAVPGRATDARRWSRSSRWER